MFVDTLEVSLRDFLGLYIICFFVFFVYTLFLKTLHTVLFTNIQLYITNNLKRIEPKLKYNKFQVYLSYVDEHRFKNTMKCVGQEELNDIIE